MIFFNHIYIYIYIYIYRERERDETDKDDTEMRQREKTHKERDETERHTHLEFMRDAFRGAIFQKTRVNLRYVCVRKVCIQDIPIYVRYVCSFLFIFMKR